MSKKNKPQTKPTETKPQTFAERMFERMSKRTDIRVDAVKNGISIWVGNIRVLKKGNGFPRDCLLFPRPEFKELVNDGKVTGIITPKNVAQITVEDTNEKMLFDMMDLTIKTADEKQKERAKNKAKKVSEKKDGTTGKAKRLENKAAKAVETKSEAKTTPPIKTEPVTVEKSKSTTEAVNKNAA